MRLLHFIVLSLALLACGFLAARPALAEEAAEPVAEPVAEQTAEPVAEPAKARSPQSAEQLFLRGLQLLKADDYAGAAQHFERSLELVHTVSARFNLANAYSALGRCSEAERQFRKLSGALEAAPNPTLAEQTKTQRARLSDCFAELSLVASPASAQLEVDGQSHPDPKRLRLDPGPHRLELSARGFASEQRTLTLARGERRQIEWSLPQRMSRLELLVKPAQAELFLDGKPRGSVFENPVELPPGRHRLKIQRPGYVAQERRIRLEPGETRVLKLELAPLKPALAHRPPQPTAPQPLAPLQPTKDAPVAASNRPLTTWLVTGLSAAGAVSTGVLWFVTHDKHDEYETRAAQFNERTSSALDSEDSRQALLAESESLSELGSDVQQLKLALFTTAAITAVAAGVTAWLWLTPEHQGPQKPLEAWLREGAVRF